MINKSLVLVPISLFISAFARITLNTSEIAQILLKNLEFTWVPVTGAIMFINALVMARKYVCKNCFAQKFPKGHTQLRGFWRQERTPTCRGICSFRTYLKGYVYKIKKKEPFLFLLQAWKLYERSQIIELVDPKLKVDGTVERDVLQVCDVALLCLQPYPSLRPPMSEIVMMLACKTEPTPTPMKPAFLDRKNRFSTEGTSLVLSPSPFRIDSPSSHIEIQYLSMPL